MSVRRVLMFTYYVHNDSSQTPRLMRAVNMWPPQALAGVIEDLTLSYDLVDGVYNPTNVKDAAVHVRKQDVTYSANQIRKVNLHVGVRCRGQVSTSGGLRPQPSLDHRRSAQSRLR